MKPAFAPSQRQRVIRLLLDRGPRGISQRDFLLPGVVDGGKPIARLASRIDELRQEGADIVAGGWRSSFRIYVLREGTEVAHVPSRLFDPE
jgi:hypothetical protein